MAMKLSMVLAIVEIIGVIDVQRDSRTSAIIHHVLTMLYNTTRSFRGGFLFAIFFMTKNVLKHFKFPSSTTPMSIRNSNTGETTMSY